MVTMPRLCIVCHARYIWFEDTGECGVCHDLRTGKQPVKARRRKRDTIAPRTLVFGTTEQDQP